MRVIIIRHGRTQCNAERRFSGGRTDSPLSPEGREMLREIPEPMEQSLLYVSPMQRALETAEILFPGKQKLIREGLRELDFGRWDGKTHEEIEDDPYYQAWLKARGTAVIPDGETLEVFRERTMRAFREILAEARSQGMENIYIVAHGGTAMAVLSSLTGKPYYGLLPQNGEGFWLECALTPEEGTDDGFDITAISYGSFTDGVHSGSSDR